MTSYTAWAAVIFMLWLLIMIYARRTSRRMPIVKDARRTDMFLTRIMHKAACEDVHFTVLVVDCFAFDFRPYYPNGIEPENWCEFIKYMQTLDLTNGQSIVKLCIWLMQNNLKFDLKFAYNHELPLLYNLKQLRRPGKLKRLLNKEDPNALMHYDLSRDTHALRKQR